MSVGAIYKSRCCLSSTLYYSLLCAGWPVAAKEKVSRFMYVRTQKDSPTYKILPYLLQGTGSKFWRYVLTTKALKGHRCLCKMGGFFLKMGVCFVRMEVCVVNMSLFNSKMGICVMKMGVDFRKCCENGSFIFENGSCIVNWNGVCFSKMELLLWKWSLFFENGSLCCANESLFFQKWCLFFTMEFVF